MGREIKIWWFLRDQRRFTWRMATVVELRNETIHVMHKVSRALPLTCLPRIFVCSQKVPSGTSCLCPMRDCAVGGDGGLREQVRWHDNKQVEWKNLAREKYAVPYVKLVSKPTDRSQHPNAAAVATLSFQDRRCLL